MAKKNNDANLPAVLKDYALVKADPKLLPQIMQENVGAGGLTPFDLDRIKVPAGGGTIWEVPTIEGIANEERVDGVIIYWREPRAYWSESFDESGGGTPPECSSEDGIHGLGSPGGECAQCPLSQFGTDPKNKRGQACKQMRFLFMLRPESLIPQLVVVPPTSLREIRSYFLRLASQTVSFYAVVTSLSLVKEKNADGITYSKIIPSTASRLDADQVEFVRSYSKGLTGAFDTVDINPDD